MTIKKLDPWLHIWTQPRAVIRQELRQRPNEGYLIFIAFLASIVSYVQFLLSGSSLAPTFELSFPILTISALWILFGTLFVFYVSSFFLWLVGKWIGGKANFADIRIVNIRALLVPMLTLDVAYYVLGYLLFGEQIFSREAIFLSLDFPYFCFSIWAFIVSIKSISEAQKLSPLISFLGALVSGIFALVFFLFIVVLFLLLFSTL